MKKKLLLLRLFSDEKHTLGLLYVIQGKEIIFTCKTLELPWRNNEKGISSAPEGTYPIVLERSPKFKTSLWELKNVPERSEIKIHTANYVRQLNGCIAVGSAWGDIDSDGITDILNSANTLKKLHYALAGEKSTTIKIVDYDDII